MMMKKIIANVSNVFVFFLKKKETDTNLFSIFFVSRLIIGFFKKATSFAIYLIFFVITSSLRQSMKKSRFFLQWQIIT